MSDMKTCNKCKKILPTSSFRKRGGEKYLRTECKECDKQLIKARQDLKKIYGTPPINYRCPICDRSEEECKGQGNKQIGAWVIDHCHKTNTFRGWLCHKCNRGLGAFNDDIAIICKAITYLTGEQCLI